MIYKSLGVILCVASAAKASVPGSSNLFFVETFDEGDPFESGRWVKSVDEKYVDQPVMVKTANIPIAGFEGDKGVQLTQELKYYGFGAKFPTPLDPQVGGDIVIQYEVKLEELLACGGAYVKLPRVSESLDMSRLNSDTPYSVMFGPDKCGSSNKVHFIVQYQNPVTHEWQEKHFNETIAVKNDKQVHLYTLVLRADDSFEILVDSHPVKSGSLLTHLTPPINPPQFIDDATDSKPADWVDEAQIADPAAEKPADWDEDAPRKIPDSRATMPAAWLPDAPLKIPDPKASKPEDWDDEEDGEWEAPLVDNPACEAAGCGPWSPPQIPNPAYKGKWRAPKIANPAFVGKWAPRQVSNPAYFYEPHPFTHLAPMAGIAVEVWTTSAAILFDNFVVARSLGDALGFARETFRPKHEVEVARDKAAAKDKKAADRKQAAANGGFRAFAEAKTMDLVDFFNEQPLALGGSVLAVVLAFLYLVFAGTSDKERRPKKQARPTPAAETAAAAAEQPAVEPVADATATADKDE